MSHLEIKRKREQKESGMVIKFKVTKQCVYTDLEKTNHYIQLSFVVCSPASDA